MPSYTTGSWAPASVETLKTMWSEGASASQIASALGAGYSRSAVIGKVHRLNLPGHHGAGRPRSEPKPKVKPKSNNGGGVAFAIARARKEGAQGSALEAVFGQPKVSVPLKTIVDEGPGISLLDLNEHTCRWPIGDPLKEGFVFCGKPPMENKRYCAKHHARSVQR